MPLGYEPGVSVAAAVHREREAFAETAHDTDPDGPTLCEGWRVRDLLAHLVIRDRRPDATPGIFVPGLAVWTGAVQQRLARRDPAELVEIVRHGPPPYVPAAYPPMDRIDLLEYFVHHEDVRRAGGEREPRPADPERDRTLWTILAMAGPSMHWRSPVGIVLRRPDGLEHRAHPGLPGRGRVVITGEVGELVLHTVGRSAAVVTVDGRPDDVAAVRALDRAI